MQTWAQESGLDSNIYELHDTEEEYKVSVPGFPYLRNWENMSFCDIIKIK